MNNSFLYLPMSAFKFFFCFIWELELPMLGALVLWLVKLYIIHLCRFYKAYNFSVEQCLVRKLLRAWGIQTYYIEQVIS